MSGPGAPRGSSAGSSISMTWSSRRLAGTGLRRQGDRAHHVALEITPAQRLRFVTLLSRAADEAELPGDPRVPRCDHVLRRVGVAAGDGQFGRGRETVRARAGASLGVGVAPPYQSGPDRALG